MDRMNRLRRYAEKLAARRGRGETVIESHYDNNAAIRGFRFIALWKGEEETLQIGIDPRGRLFTGVSKYEGEKKARRLRCRTVAGNWIDA